MKKIFTLLLLCCTCFVADATVFVSGNITTNTTWTTANSPYIVNGNLTVDSGITLTIQPGVTVRVDSTYTFIVNGNMVAEGTASDTIKFTSNSVNPLLHPWEGITINSGLSNDSSRLRYCRFELSKKSIQLLRGDIRMYHSVFRYNANAIHVHIAGFSNPYKHYIVINNCLITQNDTGVYNSGSGNISSKITWNEISYNNIGMREENNFNGFNNFNYNEFNYNVVGYSSIGGVFGCRLNTFKGNSQYGVYVNCATPDDISYISESKFYYNATAIYINNAQWGSVYGNQIAYNNIGIHDNYTYTGTNKPRGLLQMFGNCYHENMLYNFREDGRYGVNSNGDWWGSNTVSIIDSFIYDFYDNPSSAIIAYTNRATVAGVCASVPPPPPCNDPDSLEVIATSSNTATASWAAVAGAPAYEYYIIPITSTPPSAGVVTTTNTVSLSGLTAGETYSFCVRTRCQSMPFLSAWVCDTIIMPCTEPTNIVISNLTSTTATVSWSPVAGVGHYEYYVAPTPSAPPASGTLTGSTTVLISGLAPGITFDFCVRSVCGNMASEWICDTMQMPTSIGADPHAPQPRIYPNPSNGIFMADIPAAMQAGDATVLDVNGRIIARKTYTPGTTLKFELGNIAKGIYVVQFTNPSATYHTRLTVQ